MYTCVCVCVCENVCVSGEGAVGQQRPEGGEVAAEADRAAAARALVVPVRGGQP